MNKPKAFILSDRTDISLPPSHPFHNIYVYDTIEKSWYNKQTDIFLSHDDALYHKLPIMDPQQALTDLLEAIHNVEHLQTLEALDALHQWISNGGVLPTIRKDAIDLTPVDSQTIYFVPKVL